ncbi:hypothetical protein FRZ67_11665 [Panacibacter ginsenosidivorans]|uniref:Uncharacterized protein n=1 Tax=Panacibacter ginsenosidivorans TaxID=1813871 RepID=A0A5B8V9V9_9BACT|nr:hypothetical protein [Panacibacter ginsenosidivorans]QEC67925.1 hypothetical protein FRZ67_11665 [Panacibacter ginsenosidivorans]
MPNQQEKQLQALLHEQTGCSENILFAQLEQQGYSRQELHALLHKIVLHEATQCRGKRSRNKFSKLYHRTVYFFNQLSGKALSMLRSQFAKKPKNPV